MRLETHQAHIFWWFGSELPPIPSVSRFPQEHFGLGGDCGQFPRHLDLGLERGLRRDIGSVRTSREVSV